MRSLRLFAVGVLTFFLASGIVFAGGRAGVKIGDPISSVLVGLHPAEERIPLYCDSLDLAFAMFADADNKLTAGAVYDPAGSLRLVLYDSTHSGEEIVLYGDQKGTGKISVIGEPGDETFGDSPCSFFE